MINPPSETSTLALLSLDGLSVGDAFGQQFFYPELFQKGVSRRQLPVHPWKYTDDTVMAISVTEQLLANGAIDQDALAKAFTRRFYEDPGRGYGSGMQDLLRRLDDGVPWRTAATELFGGGSYGNGAAMRVAPLGVFFSHDLERAVHEARLSAEVTHAHAEGVNGAIAVAAAAVWAARRRSGLSEGDHLDLLRFVVAVTPAGKVRDGLERAATLGPTAWAHDAANQLGNGSQITAMDTVPFCLWCAATHYDNYEEALWTVAQVGGDIDTNAAIVGGIVALSSTPPGIPADWIRCRESLRTFFDP